MKVENVKLNLFVQTSYKRFSELSETELESDSLLLGKTIIDEKEIKALVRSGSLALEIMDLRKLENPLHRIEVLYSKKEYQASSLTEGERKLVLDCLSTFTDIALNDPEEIIRLKPKKSKSSRLFTLP